MATTALRNFLPACDFSLQTFGHRARFYPASVVFRNSLVGKPTKTFSFQLFLLVEAKIPALLERDQAVSRPSPNNQIALRGAAYKGPLSTLANSSHRLTWIQIWDL